MEGSVGHLVAKRAALRPRGVAQGDRVALLLTNSVEFFETSFAIAKRCAISVLLKWRLISDGLELALRDRLNAVLTFGGEIPFAVGSRSKLREPEHRDHCQASLARSKQRKGGSFLDEPPRNPRGKVLTRALCEQSPGLAGKSCGSSVCRCCR